MNHWIIHLKFYFLLFFHILIRSRRDSPILTGYNEMENKYMSFQIQQHVYVVGQTKNQANLGFA
jgi:hypothetical protein